MIIIIIISFISPDTKHQCCAIEWKLCLDRREMYLLIVHNIYVLLCLCQVCAIECFLCTNRCHEQPNINETYDNCMIIYLFQSYICFQRWNVFNLIEEGKVFIMYISEYD